MKIGKIELVSVILEKNKAKLSNKNNTEDDDYITNTIGAMGRWQIKYIIMISLLRFVPVWTTFSIIFIAPKTDFICIRSKETNFKEAVNSTCYDNCLEYRYYTNALKSNLVSEFGLICENEWLTSFTQTTVMFGMLIGVCLFGWVSDRFGRRVGILLAMTIYVTFSLASPFSPTYWILATFKIFCGMASGGLIIITGVLILEIIGCEYREIVGTCCITPDGTGEAILSLFAYYTSSWRSYTLCYSIASVLFFMLAFFIPESPRWLITNGEYEKARELLEKAAIFNKKSTDDINNVVIEIKHKADRKVIEKQTTYLDLFSTYDLTKKIIYMILLNFVTGLSFYGLAQYTTYLGPNVYITMVILGLTQVPLGFFAALVNKIFGRKKTLIAAFSIVGVTMGLINLIPEGHWARVFLALVGFLSSGTLFAVLVVYISELFPTSMRNMASGMGSVGSKTGAMVAPFIANITPQWIPSVIFALVVIMPIIVCFLLPETKGNELCDRIENKNVTE